MLQWPPSNQNHINKFRITLAMVLGSSSPLAGFTFSSVFHLILPGFCFCARDRNSALFVNPIPGSAAHRLTQMHIKSPVLFLTPQIFSCNPAKSHSFSKMGALLSSCWFLVVVVVLFFWFLPPRSSFHSNGDKPERAFESPGVLIKILIAE